jgi:alkanesulfonate monooxygenase SsuD/methylene tetrahydromethanopterin reductase-like flavin-dependent oxidoreductase (luciferase family)
MRDRLGAERGWAPMSRADFDREAEGGAIYVGSPETVARRIAVTAKGLSLSHFRIKYSAGQLSHDKIMRNIELYGRRVMPLVRDMLSA